MKRTTGAIWIAALSALYMDASCAQGSNVADDGSVGGGNAGGAGTAMQTGPGGTSVMSTSTSITAASSASVSNGTTSTSGGGLGGMSGSVGSVGAAGGIAGGGASGGVGGSGGAGGGEMDGGMDASDAGKPTGFGSCVTQQDFDNQSSQLFQVGFCPNNPFACAFGGCPDDAVDAGDIVCSPTCVCTPMPPICMPDAGIDAPDDTADDGGDAAILDAVSPD